MAANPKQVLVICGDQYHSAEDVMLGLGRVGKSDFHFQPANSAAVLAGDAAFDAVVLAKLNVKSPQDPAPWADETSDHLIREFVNSGGGLLVIHAGTVGYHSAPGIRSLTGGAFQHHPEACEVELLPSAHLLSTGVAPFTVRDEHYFVEIDSGVEMFLTSHSNHGGQPAGWTNTGGGGRVCALTPGHFPGVWAHQSFEQLLKNALLWVTHG